MSSNPQDTSNLPKLLRCPTCGAALEAIDAPSVQCKYCGNNVAIPAKYRSQPQVQPPQIVFQQTTPVYDYSGAPVSGWG
jgi:DNA-directed RNA polymerase subunit RPC12/RpoP